MLLDAARAGDQFRVAILDKHVPEGGAEELARRVRADSRLSTVALLAMIPIDEHPQAGKAPPSIFAGQVRKPILRNALLEVVKDAVSGSRRQRKPAGRGTKPRAARPRSQARLLMAEDNPVNREVARTVLDLLGYSVTCVTDGRQAVEALRAEHYDLVLMDCEMPEMDGYEATRLIRHPDGKVLDPRIPIIAVTAAAMAGDRERCLEAGMDDYISKPVRASSLIELVERYCGQPAEGPALSRL